MCCKLFKSDENGEPKALKICHGLYHGCPRMQLIVIMDKEEISISLLTARTTTAAHEKEKWVKIGYF